MKFLDAIEANTYWHRLGPYPRSSVPYGPRLEVIQAAAELPSVYLKQLNPDLQEAIDKHYQDQRENGAPIPLNQIYDNNFTPKTHNPYVEPAWVTKDSGERRVHESGMVRDQDADKPAFHLILPDGIPYKDQMLTRLAGLYARGAAKYGDRNWEKSRTREDEEHIKGSLFRHLVALLTGETDEDHAAAVMWNTIALELVRARLKEADDVA